MSRTERLFDLLQVLRRHRRPVSGRALAEELGVSLRSLYRDVASLQALGADIRGEPGVGYALKPGFMLPPLMFPPEEIEALALGLRWVGDRGDGRLGEAARSALARVAAVLPPDARAEILDSGLIVGPGADIPADAVDPALLRKAIRTGRKLDIAYRDGAGAETRRTVWPVALAFLDRVRILVAWCELRSAFRHFRTDRIVEALETDRSFPGGRRALLKQWRSQEAISDE